MSIPLALMDSPFCTVHHLSFLILKKYFQIKSGENHLCFNVIQYQHIFVKTSNLTFHFEKLFGNKLLHLGYIL